MVTGAREIATTSGGTIIKEYHMPYAAFLEAGA